MSFYVDQHLSLNSIIERASDNTGATILIPDLQRPYVWKPNQVVLLVDSLIRGWPFGTLLLWKVHHDDLSNIPSRPFWRVVDRTEEDGGEIVSRKTPPAEFHMVLDGQQRMQSLLLAFGGDSWGFKMHDRNWREEVEGERPRGTFGIPHWSIGNLCLDLNAFADEYENASDNLLGIDYTHVLTWVVTDAATGKSTTAKQSSYVEPLQAAFASNNKGRFIRLSRLWHTAQPNPNFKEAQFRQLVDPVLKAYEVDLVLKERLLSPLGELLATFRDLRNSFVHFLELQPFNETITSRDDYNESIVNIFTRLNTAGRTLTREEITFAWLKTGWDILATGNRSAVKCVTDLKDTLAEIEVNLDNDETVGALSFLWSVCFNQGRLLSNKDLLKGETISPMASQLSQNWDALVNSVVSTAMQVNYRGLEYGKHYLSFNALVIFLTWKFLLDEWIDRQTLTTLQKDAAQKRGDELIREFCDRWLLCSQWAGTWGASGGKVVAAFASQLSADRRAIQLAMSAEAVVATLRTRMQEWLKSFEQAASNMIRTLGIAKREQVGEYYAPLWLWHRLEGERWACSQITLRNKLRGKARLEVDHVASVKLLEDRISDAPATEIQTLGGRDDVATVLNSIGNCFLIEKTFNISKGKRSLYDFLGEVHEFSQGDVERNKWAGALSVSESLLLSDVADLTELVMTIKAREAILKGDLVKFVSGSATRIDLK